MRLPATPDRIAGELRATHPSISIGVRALALFALAIVGVATLIVLESRPLDTTAPHGDACLDEPLDGRVRCWDEFVPAGLGTGAFSLLVDIHGFHNTPDQQRALSDLEALAMADRVILSWPYGIDQSWNGGGDPWPSDIDPGRIDGIGCCGHALSNEIDDVSFIAAMIEQLSRTYNIDSDRVFLTGSSNGCVLAQRIAAEASSSIDGIACMAGYLLVEPSPDYRPIPIMEIHGTADPVFAYETNRWPGAVANFDLWRERNGCAEPQEVWRQDQHSMIEASGCTTEASVALVTLQDIGHDVYPTAGSESVDTRQLMWDFLIGRTD